MLHEVMLKTALEAYLAGKDVKAVLPMDEEEDRVIPFERLFNEARFLVDRKAATVNEDFETAVQDMAREDAAKTAADSDKPLQNRSEEPEPEAPAESSGGVPRKRPPAMWVPVPNGRR